MLKISNPPNAEALMQGARSIGNYNLAAALGALIDNSITAAAKTVQLTCNYNEGEPIIIIKDDGYVSFHNNRSIVITAHNYISLQH